MGCLPSIKDVGNLEYELVNLFGVDIQKKATKDELQLASMWFSSVNQCPGGKFLFGHIHINPAAGYMWT